MSKAFVGTQQSVTLERLTELVEKHVGSAAYAFWRWPHDVLLDALQNQPTTGLKSDEGQAFNATTEIRWRHRGEQFDVLLLAKDKEKVQDKECWEEMEGDWHSQEREAMVYLKSETSLPRKVILPSGLTLGQRYFIDSRTGYVQFVALRVKS
ncbi:MAG: hypothetical protein AAFQ40_09215 [Cyanobacteria bacterium J06623_5]